MSAFRCTFSARNASENVQKGISKGFLEDEDRHEEGRKRYADRAKQREDFLQGCEDREMARIAYHRKYLTEKNSERANQIALRHSREENRMDAKRKSNGNVFLAR